MKFCHIEFTPRRFLNLVRGKTTVHTELKQWLLELGEKSGYEAYSGDSEPIDIRIKKKHIEYFPDVIWNWKGGLYITEIAFSEDWRAIVGEFFLASMIKNIKGFFMITVGDSGFTYDLFHIIDKKMGFGKWISYTFDNSDLRNLEKMKANIKSWLKQNQWI
jgi:hypothetical protein